MTLCIKTGYQCNCQPDAGVFCPDYKPDWYVQCLMAAITEQRKVIDRCHHALGESEHSDDESLPDAVALHISERNQRIAELERRIAPEAARGVTIPFDLWDEIHDFIYGQVDVMDGSDGPRPNKAMHLFQRIETEVSEPQNGEAK